VEPSEGVSSSDRAGAPCLQERYAPASICFGCGPANAQGLHIRSHAEGDEVVAEWTPRPQYEAFPGMVNGGIIGALLDCHSNWTAATALMHKHGWAAPECTVTADFHVKLRRPTPYGKPFCDVDGDQNVVAMDVVAIINYINAGRQLGGEAEAGQPPVASSPEPVAGDLMALLAADVAAEAVRKRKG